MKPVGEHPSGPDSERNLGPQPLDALMSELGVTHDALVKASPDQLTFKQVARARQGRRLTRRMQEKVRDAFQRASGTPRALEELFNYRA